jgi:hypothetical protein
MSTSQIGCRLRIGCASLAVATALLTSVECRADLYGETVLSLEWLVDSSDAICHVSVPRDDTIGTMSIKETLKSRIGTSEFHKAASRWGRLGPPPEPIEEWLFFLRKQSTGEHRIFGSINLTRPFESPRYAAVTQKGVLLPDRRTILHAVNARIKERRPLPPDCNRDLVDSQSTEWAGNYNPTSKAQAEREWLLVRFGGFLHPQLEIGYWNDRDGPYNHDTLVSIVVPAEPEYKATFLKRLSSNERFSENDFDDPSIADRMILAMVNYPGEDTLKVLRELRGGKDPISQKVSRFLTEREQP